MMLFPAVLMNFPNSEVCLIGEWPIEYNSVAKGLSTQYDMSHTIVILTYDNEF